MLSTVSLLERSMAVSMVGFLGLRRNLGILSMVADCDRKEQGTKERTGADEEEICRCRGRVEDVKRGGRGREGEEVGKGKGEDEIEEEEQRALGWWRSSRGRTRDWLLDLDNKGAK